MYSISHTQIYIYIYTHIYIYIYILTYTHYIISKFPNQGIETTFFRLKFAMTCQAFGRAGSQFCFHVSA